MDRFAPHHDLARNLLQTFRNDGDGSHDLSHLVRVWRSAREIHAQEGGDLEAIAASVLLHDCVPVPKNSPMRKDASHLAAVQARNVLAALAWEQARIEIVSGAIESHSYSAGIPPTTLEGRILQDADRLDAIGFIGMARCFYTAGRMGSSLYHAGDPVGNQRPLDDANFALDHFPRKLLRLTEGFQTATGSRLALLRQRVLQDFYEGMLLEIGP